MKSHPPSLGSFQSHAGSIEAVSSLRSYRITSWFQSHAGSIEARPAVAGAWMGVYCFNPTLVRLRRLIARASSQRPSRFNPTLVRLRPYQSWISRPRPRLFQSHAGSIEASPARAARAWRPCFNPTLVRLRPVSKYSSHSCGGGFNPTLVRLRLFWVTVDLNVFSRFNPTLVRLRRGRPSGTWRRSRRFQSHAGSIEALDCEQARLAAGAFQSHAGSIEAVGRESHAM